MTGRTPQAQLSTARLILAQANLQIAAYEEHQKSTEAMKRKAIKNGKFDPSILDRIDGLRELRTKWSARVEELEKQIGETS